LKDGDYTFYIAQDPNADSSQRVSQNVSFNWDSVQEFVLNVSHDCVTIKVVDGTSYPNGTGIPDSRNMNITYPVVPGVVNTDLVGTNAGILQISMVLADGLVWEYVTWQIQGTSSGIFQQLGEKNWTIEYPVSYEGSKNFDVICALDPCGVIDCVDAAWLELYDESCSRGGYSKLPTAQADNLIELLGNLTLYTHWAKCGNMEKALVYYDRLVSLTSVTCSQSTDPRPVSSTVTGYGVWTEIPSSAYINSFAQGTDPLAFKIINQVMYFKGNFQTPNLVAGPTNIIDPTYWTNLGIVLEDNVTIWCVETGYNSVGSVVINTASGNLLNLYAFIGVVGVSLEIAVAGTVPAISSSL
jgi:uncharacterized protein YfiM (DUF2279 family)